MTCIECWSTSSTKSLNRSYEWNRDSHSRNHIHHSALPDTLFPCDGGEDLMEGLSTQACVGRGVCGWSQCCRARVFIGGYIEAATQVTQMRVLKYSHLSDLGGGLNISAYENACAAALRPPTHPSTNTGLSRKAFHEVFASIAWKQGVRQRGVVDMIATVRISVPFIRSIQ